jgi:hypothetical protein
MRTNILLGKTTKDVMNSIKKKLDAIPSEELTKEDIQGNLLIVRDNLKYTESTIVRSSRFLLLIAIVFELISRAAVSELSFSGVKITDLSLIQKTLPLIAAYFYYTTMSGVAMRRLLTEFHDRLFTLLSPKFRTEDFELFLLPFTPLITERIIANNTNGWISKLIRNLSLPLMIIVLLGPLIFEAYAFYELFYSFGVKDVVTWIVLSISLVFITHGIMYGIGTDNITSRE